jgi:hypothetical protein
VWNGEVDAATNPVIALADESATWYKGLAAGQTISIKYNVVKDGPVCLHIYDVDGETILAETNLNSTAGKKNEFNIVVDEEFLSNLSTEKIMIGGSGVNVTSVSINL